MDWTSWSQTWAEDDDNEQETSEMKSEEFALKTNALVLRADQRPKQNHKDEILPALPERPYLLGKEFGPMLNQENIQSRIMKCRRNQFIFFVMEVYIEKTMERLNSGESKTIWGTVSLLSSLVWRQVEEYKGRRRKQQQISVLYWFFRRNSLSPSSSRSFWTQSYWFFITRQCLDSERLLPIHLSCRMCNQFIFHHQFGIDTWRSKFEQQTDSILHVCGSHGQKP